jgi:hypothetical protein
MKIVPVTEQEAVDALPETFDDVNDPILTPEEAELAADLVLKAIKTNPNEHFFKIVLER